MQTITIRQNALEVADQLFLDEFEFVHVIGEFQNEAGKESSNIPT